MPRIAHHPSQGATRRAVSWAAASALTGLTLLSALGPAHAQGVPGQGTWETTLQGRDLDGNVANGFEAFYDTALNITWLADANYAQTSGYIENGLLSWGSARTWLTNLDVNGVSGWRLPTMIDTGAPGCDTVSGGGDCGYGVNTSTSEMAHMYYVTLGNKAASIEGISQLVYGLQNTGPFVNIKAYYHWLDLGYAPDLDSAWGFDTNNGYQYHGQKSSALAVWAVRPGDVAAPVPEPQIIALALAGLAVAGVAARRRHL